MSRLAIMTAMGEELAGLLADLKMATSLEFSGRKYHFGNLWGRQVVLAASGWGKVAAASCTKEIIIRFHPSEILFVGLAGSLTADLSAGDIIIGTHVIQCDQDLSPFFPRQLRGVDPARVLRLSDACKRASDDKGVVIWGGIGTGDRFIKTEKERKALLEEFPDIACVEMEGAAVAQVCAETDTGFSIARIISDSADESATQAFSEFVRGAAASQISRIVKEFLSTGS